MAVVHRDSPPTGGASKGSTELAIPAHMLNVPSPGSCADTVYFASVEEANFGDWGNTERDSFSSGEQEVLVGGVVVQLNAEPLSTTLESNATLRSLGLEGLSATPPSPSSLAHRRSMSQKKRHRRSSLFDISSLPLHSSAEAVRVCRLSLFCWARDLSSLPGVPVSKGGSCR